MLSAMVDKMGTLSLQTIKIIRGRTSDMANIGYRWSWEADKPSQIHCGQCGFPQFVTPSAIELQEGFCWYCVKCGIKSVFGDPKLVERKTLQPKPVEPKQIELLQNNLKQPLELGLGYPQTKRLFERKKVSEWISLMIGDVLNFQKCTAIATKIKAHYRFVFHKNPTKIQHQNAYSGIELNACMERMYTADYPLAIELQTLHLNKIRAEIEVGSIVVSNRGNAREVVKIIGDTIFLDIEGQFLQFDRSAVMSIVHLSSENGF